MIVGCNRWFITVVILAAVLTAGAAGAQGNSSAMGSPHLVTDPCKRDVLKYQANIDLVRKSLGDKEADTLAARFMSKADWDATLIKEGYCGLATRLRQQKLVQ